MRGRKKETLIVGGMEEGGRERERWFNLWEGKECGESWMMGDREVKGKGRERKQRLWKGGERKRKEKSTERVIIM